MFASYERWAVMSAAALMSLIVAIAILRRQKTSGLPLACSTPALTGALLAFYYFSVRDPSHGIGILILPLATGWLWWRQQQPGKPSFAQSAFVLLQLLIGAAYLLVVGLQER